MIVADLIKKLKECDQDALVVLSGHSDAGFDDYSKAYEVKEALVKAEYSWRGSHVDSKDGEPAVHIS